MDNKTLTLLLTPWLISTGTPAIDFLTIKKNGKSISFTTTRFTRTELATATKNYPVALKDILVDCCAENLEKIANNCQLRLANQKAGIGYSDFCIQKLYRSLAQNF